MSDGGTGRGRRAGLNLASARDRGEMGTQCRIRGSRRGRGAADAPAESRARRLSRAPPHSSRPRRRSSSRPRDDDAPSECRPGERIRIYQYSFQAPPVGGRPASSRGRGDESFVDPAAAPASDDHRRCLVEHKHHETPLRSDQAPRLRRGARANRARRYAASGARKSRVSRRRVGRASDASRLPRSSRRVLRAPCSPTSPERWLFTSSDLSTTRGPPQDRGDARRRGPSSMTSTTRT